ncbi:resolvase [Leptospirillum ferriphilum YSK]|uniref:Resolvase n=1 Tax=Leptospirillum ferriphilum YSK TaxID=1441628 RepID=A0A059XUY4_9BACT|nr:recombinase family protein [Leptospirillum ferriphilum]AIA30648.1 resolvase [Leptospirillum ferriphilum YSK]
MERLVGVGEAKHALGVPIAILRQSEAAGRLSAEYIAGGHRRFDLANLYPEIFPAEDEANRRTVAYARVSGHGQKDDLERQKQMPELYCAHQGWKFEVMADPDYCQANWRKVYL